MDIQNNLPEVAIVILNWNGRDFLAKFLPSVLASSYENKRVVVADNASTDDSVSFLRENFPSVEIILNQENGGFAKGYNSALKKVQADYFVLLNSDVEVSAGWIEPVITLMEQDKNIAACQPKILSEKDRDHFEYAGACGGWIDKLGYPFSRGRVLDHIEADHGQYNDAALCFWASGAAMFVRPEIFFLLGGFDEYFFAHQEEIDLCWRMQLSGYKVFVQPASVVYHVGGGTLPKSNSKKTFLNFRNNLIMIFKNEPAGRLWWLLPKRFFLDNLAAWKGLLSGDGGYFVAVIKARLAFLKWIFTARKRSPVVRSGKKCTKGVYPGSILWQYYIKKKRTFSEITAAK